MSVNVIIFFALSVPAAFKELEVFTKEDDGPCSDNGTSVYIRAAAVPYMAVAYHVPVFTTILVVILIVAIFIARFVTR